MISIQKNQIPDYLYYSEFFKNIVSEDTFEIPEEFYKQELVINTFDELLCYIKILDYWMVNKTPKLIYKWIFENRDKINLECLTDNYLNNEIELIITSTYEEICSKAAEKGYLDCLIAARENGCPWENKKEDN